MATQLQIRRGTSSQVAAFTGAEGEVVVNTTNDSIHVNDGSTAGGFELARVDGSNWAITNNISTTANISFGDNDKAIFGAGPDLRIYHDGSNSYINDTSGTGNLYIASNQLIINNAANSENMARFVEDGAATLYYDGSAKIATTSTGIDVTGVITTDGMTTSADVSFGDNDKAIFGAGSDLQIYHDGSNSYLKDAGTGDLYIQGEANVRITDGDGNKMFLGQNDGEVQLYHNGAEKFHTTATGVNVTGTVTADGLTVDGATLLNNGTNSTHLTLTGTASRGLTISTTNTGGQNDSGVIYDAQDTAGGGVGSHEFRVGGESKLLIAADGDISFYEDTGTTPKFFWDASTERLGIGTTSPYGALTVDTANGILNIANGNTSGGTKIQAWASTPANGYLAIEGFDKEYMRIDSSGNVGIGTSSPNSYSGYTTLTLNHATNGSILDFELNGALIGEIYTQDSSTFAHQAVGARALAFRTNGTERMRISSGGDWMVSNTVANVASGYNNQGGCGWVESDNHFEIATTSNRSSLEIGRNNANSGDLITFRQQSTSVGYIGSYAGTRLGIGSASATGILFGGSDALPATSGTTLADDTYSLGNSSYRWDNIYATSGTVNTSDRNEKQDIEELSDAELRVAVACKGLLRKYRWKTRVAAKGDDARIHFGIIAQDLQAAFEAEGLDAGRYGMFINTTWTDEETGEERSRMGVRYSELLAFIIAAI